MSLFKKLYFIFALLLSCVAFVALASAAEGYTVTSAGKETNIKWTLSEDGTLTFAIDEGAEGKEKSTGIANKDPLTGSVADWNACLPTYKDAKKIIIGDGITEIAGFTCLKSLESVEIPTSLVSLGSKTFESCSKLKCIYIRGTEATEGHFDLSNISKIGAYCFDGVTGMKTVKLNLALNGALSHESFKYTGLSELEIPESVTKIPNKTLSKSFWMKTLIIKGSETVIESDKVFDELSSFPAIKAKSGSKAEAFAKEYGFTFIDIDTGEVTIGERKTTGIDTDSETPKEDLADPITEFEPVGATLWGHSTDTYQLASIVNTWWAYYDDTKTLEFYSGTSGYNETGLLRNVDKEFTDWSAYKNEIEHIIIGDRIQKISGGAFSGYKSLKDIRLGKSVNQIDIGAFNNCPNLTTIWRDGTDRVEGRYDFSKISKFNSIFSPNAPIKEIVLNSKVEELVIELPLTLKTIYTDNMTDSLINYAKERLFNIVGYSDPTVKHEFYIEVDSNLPSCGGRAVYDFDEATGTITVLGGGAIKDITNYYGGGSKTQPWFSIRDKVKHIVITEKITAIGKYAFCEFKNLETVQIPNTEEFTILNAAFEKCYNLKSIYREGTDPIVGTLDLRNVKVIEPWTFAYDYLIANIIVSDKLEKIGSTSFEENINLAAVYSTPGTYGEGYASENGLTFFDVGTSAPTDTVCTPPETTGADETTDPAESSASVSETATAETDEKDYVFIDREDFEKMQNDPWPLAGIVAVVLVALSVFIILISRRIGGKK